MTGNVPVTSSSPQLRVHGGEERRVGTAGRKGDPDLAHGDTQPRAELAKRQPNHLALRGREARAGETEATERREERVWMVKEIQALYGQGVHDRGAHHAWLQALLFMRSTWELVENVPPGEPGWRYMSAIPLP